MVGARAPGTEQISHGSYFLSFLTRKMWGGGPPELAWWTRRGWMAVPKKGENWAWLAVPKRASPGKVGLLGSSTGGGKGSGGESKGFGSGRVGVLFFESWRARGLPRAVWTHRSWPGGRGGRPRALVAGEGWGGA